MFVYRTQDTLTADIFIDNELVRSLARDKKMKAPRWEKTTHEFIAPSDGEITLSRYSTTYKLGGGVIFDDITLEEVEKIPASKKIPVLIIDGFSNHARELNTQYITENLENTGKFEVTVSTCPSQSEDKGLWESWTPAFEKYPVVIQTCNNIFKENELQWPDVAKQSFEAYVANGGGVYIYHGANNAFKNWKTYNEMIGLGWRDKDFGIALTIDEEEKVVTVAKGEGENTGHGKRTDILIIRMNNHPIHTGMPKSWLAADAEVYRYARGSADNLQVISYAQDVKTELNFPTEWIVKFGKGKVYNSTYGLLWKDQQWPSNMRCSAFQQSMSRALQWLSGNQVDNFVEEDFSTKSKKVLRD